MPLQVGLGGMCIYTLRQKGIRREYCGVRGANVEEVGATDIEETKLPTPALRIYEVSVVPCPQLRPAIVACSKECGELVLPQKTDLATYIVDQSVGSSFCPLPHRAYSYS